MSNLGDLILLINQQDPSDTLRRLREHDVSDGVLVVLSAHPNVHSDRRSLAAYELQRRREERGRREARRHLLLSLVFGAGTALLGALVGAWLS